MQRTWKEVRRLDQRENGWMAAGIARLGACRARRNELAEGSAKTSVKFAGWQIEAWKVMGKKKSLADPEEPETLAC